MAVPAARRPRSPVTNVRHEHKENKMTKVGRSGIHYSDDKVIGHGSTSIVYEGFYKKCERTREAAVKRVFSEYVTITKQEINIWLQVAANGVTLDNINIVQLFQWTEFSAAGATEYFFAMERAQGDLENRLQKMEVEGDNQWRTKCVGYLTDTANGLNWLHSKRIIHRDIKPENILIFSQNNGSNQREIAKIGDFGISKALSLLTKTGTNTEAKGSMDWLAPQAIKAMMRDQPFYSTKALDIFSFGATINYSMTCGKRHPFATGPRGNRILVFLNIQNPDVMPSLIENGEWAADHLSQWMMSYVPNGRPTIRQVLHHPFFWDLKKQLNFITDVAKSLDLGEKNSLANEAKEKLDNEYLKKNPDFKWQNSLNFELLKESKSGRGRIDKYPTNSVSHLIKVIRDKCVHHADLVDELISTSKYFGRQDETGEWFYCDEKYAEYFLKLFPDLVMFLYWFLVKDESVKTLNSVNTVKWDYGVKEFIRERFPDLPLYLLM